jgi:uncharacterized protein (DUF362 family)
MNRREFLELMALASAAALVPSGLCRAVETLLRSSPDVKVSLAGVARGSNEGDLVVAAREAAEAASDFSWLSRGDTVLIKPVVNSGNPYPATSHPAGLKALISLLKEKGAKRILVSDMSGIEHVKLSPDKMRGSTRELMMSCGVARAAEEAGAELYLPEEEGWEAFFEDGPVSGSHWRSGIMMPKILNSVDHVVLLARCSRHVLAGSTLGMKAAVGYWRTDTRLEYHHDAATLQEKTAEANTVASLRDKQRLTLTVADKVQATFGPDKGTVVAPPTGLVLASESLVAHDMVSLAWLLECRREVPEEEKKGRRDPYTSQFIVNMGNRWVVRLLGGITKAAGAERLVRHDLETIWDDRVLRRAFEISGGIPKVSLIQANPAVPEDLKRRLAEMTATSLAHGGHIAG